MMQAWPSKTPSKTPLDFDFGIAPSLNLKTSVAVICELFRQLTYCRCIKQNCFWEYLTKESPEFDTHIHGEQRVPPLLEKVVVERDVVGFEDLFPEREQIRMQPRLGGNGLT